MNSWRNVFRPRRLIQWINLPECFFCCSLYSVILEFSFSSSPFKIQTLSKIRIQSVLEVIIKLSTIFYFSAVTTVDTRHTKNNGWFLFLFAPLMTSWLTAFNKVIMKKCKDSHKGDWRLKVQLKDSFNTTSKSFHWEGRRNIGNIKFPLVMWSI